MKTYPDIPFSVTSIILRKFGRMFRLDEDPDAHFFPRHLSDDQLQEFISPHFRISEVVHSVTAQSRGLDNDLSFQDLCAATLLARDVLEPIRVFLDRPIYVSSWFRSKFVNAAVGGVANSRHLYACAADIPCAGFERCNLRTFFETLKLSVPTFKAIFYPTFVHVQI